MWGSPEHLFITAASSPGNSNNLIMAIHYLNTKKERHTKLDDLEFKKINCAPYLNDPRISQREAKLLFRLRTRMYHMKANYKGMHLNNLICNLCKSATCDQRHLLECSILKKELPEVQKNVHVRYSDLFSNDGDDKIISEIKLFCVITRKREELLDSLHKSN